MGLFDVSDERLRAKYHQAELECNRGFVNPRDHYELDHLLTQYAKENDCSYDEAYIFAKTGMKMGRLAE